MWPLYLAVIILGLLIGSFLNVLIIRLPEKQTWWGKARSMCRRCLKKLYLRDLIPVFSFIKLHGRCRFCQEKISWQYPIIEIITALLFVLAFHYNAFISFHDYVSLLRDFIFLAVLIVVFVIDLKHLLIIDRLIYVMMPIAFFLNWFIADWNISVALNMLLAAGAGFLFYWFQYYFSRGRWVGDGDMWLTALLGLMLGTSGLLFTIFGAYIVGGVIATILLLTKKRQVGAQLPMGAFLTPMAVLMILWGDLIWNGYWNIIYKIL